MLNPYYEPYWVNENELEHYGVLGMKWGVRRYQNADGTLTEAGKKRSERQRKRDLKKLKRADTKVAKGSKQLLEGQEEIRRLGRAGQKLVEEIKQMPEGPKKEAARRNAWELNGILFNMSVNLQDDAVKVWNDQTAVIEILRDLNKKYGDMALSSTDPQITSIGERYIRTGVLNDKGEEMYLTSTEPKVYADVLKKKSKN